MAGFQRDGASIGGIDVQTGLSMSSAKRARADGGLGGAGAIGIDGVQKPNIYYNGNVVNHAPPSSNVPKSQCFASFSDARSAEIIRANAQNYNLALVRCGLTTKDIPLFIPKPIPNPNSISDVNMLDYRVGVKLRTTGTLYRGNSLYGSFTPVQSLFVPLALGDPTRFLTTGSSPRMTIRKPTTISTVATYASTTSFPWNFDLTNFGYGGAFINYDCGSGYGWVNQLNRATTPYSTSAQLTSITPTSTTLTIGFATSALNLGFPSSFPYTINVAGTDSYNGSYVISGTTTTTFLATATGITPVLDPTFGLVLSVSYTTTSGTPLVYTTVVISGTSKFDGTYTINGPTVSPTLSLSPVVINPSWTLLTPTETTGQLASPTTPQLVCTAYAAPAILPAAETSGTVFTALGNAALSFSIVQASGGTPGAAGLIPGSPFYLQMALSANSITNNYSITVDFSVDGEQDPTSICNTLGIPVGTVVTLTPNPVLIGSYGASTFTFNNTTLMTFVVYSLAGVNAGNTITFTNGSVGFINSVTATIVTIARAGSMYTISATANTTYQAVSGVTAIANFYTPGSISYVAPLGLQQGPGLFSYSPQAYTNLNWVTEDASVQTPTAPPPPPAWDSTLSYSAGSYVVYPAGSINIYQASPPPPADLTVPNPTPPVISPGGPPPGSNAYWIDVDTSNWVNFMDNPYYFSYNYESFLDNVVNPAIETAISGTPSGQSSTDFQSQCVEKQLAAYMNAQVIAPTFQALSLFTITTVVSSTTYVLANTNLSYVGLLSVGSLIRFPSNSGAVGQITNVTTTIGVPDTNSITVEFQSPFTLGTAGGTLLNMQVLTNSVFWSASSSYAMGSAVVIPPTAGAALPGNRVYIALRAITPNLDPPGQNPLWAFVGESTWSSWVSGAPYAQASLVTWYGTLYTCANLLPTGTTYPPPFDSNNWTPVYASGSTVSGVYTGQISGQIASSTPFFSHDAVSGLFSLNADTYSLPGCEDSKGLCGAVPLLSRMSVPDPNFESLQLVSDTSFAALFSNFKTFQNLDTNVPIVWGGTTTINPALTVPPTQAAQPVVTAAVGQPIFTAYPSRFDRLGLYLPQTPISSQFSTSFYPVFFYKLTQDSESTSTIWSPVESIVVTSSNIPLKKELLANPTYVPINSPASFGGQQSGQNIAQIITDFSVDLKSASGYRSFIQYIPTAEYRRISLRESNLFQTLSFALYWRNRITQNLVPVTLSPGGSCNLKFLFEPIH